MRLRSKLGVLLRRRKLDAEMCEEMRLHLELLAERKIAAGMDAENARHAARREFGGVEQVKEQCRDGRGGRWLEELLRDVGFALRSLRKSPGLTTVAGVTLALGIGSCTVMFSVVNGVLLRPLALDEPEQLVQLWEDPSGTRGERNSVSGGVYADWREQATLLEEISALVETRLNLGDVAEPVRLEGMLVSAGYLELLRIRPILGRGFAPGEDQPGAANVILISGAVWQRNFGGDPGVIGRSVRLGAEQRTIVGVLPPHSLLATGMDFIAPFVLGSEEWHRRRGDHRFEVIARIKPEVTLAQVRAEMQAIAESRRHLNPAWKKDWGVTVVPLHEEMTGRIRPALLLLFGAVTLVLLIACANLANLLLAKAATRQREIAVRLAIGGSRSRIMRLLLTESVVLALVGGAAGLVVAWAGLGALTQWSADFLPRAREIAIDGRVLGFTVLVASVTGLIFGAAPAWKLSRGDVAAVLSRQGRALSPTRDRLRSALIVGQMALALMLTIGAGLLVKSLAQLLAVPPGFIPAQVLAGSLSVDAKRHAAVADRAALLRRIEERLGAEPGVNAVGFATVLPMWQRSDTFVRVENRVSQPEPGYASEFTVVAGRYLAAMGIPRLQGRDFGLRDQAPDAPPTIVVNQAFAESVFPGENPVGRHVIVWDRAREIIGVVGNVRQFGLDERAPSQIYLPEAYYNFDVHLLVGAAQPAALLPRLQQAVAATEPNLPLGRVRVLDQVLVDSTANRRLMVTLLGAFAGTALLLAALGLSGVIAYAVACRTREFGIRMALGSTRAHIRRLVLRDGLRLTSPGLGLGLLGACAFSHLLSSWLFGTAPIDALTFAAVTLLLLGVSLLACLLPARRATQVEPMVALRAE